MLRACSFGTNVASIVESVSRMNVQGSVLPLQAEAEPVPPLKLANSQPSSGSGSRAISIPNSNSSSISQDAGNPSTTQGTSPLPVTCTENEGSTTSKRASI